MRTSHRDPPTWTVVRLSRAFCSFALVSFEVLISWVFSASLDLTNFGTVVWDMGIVCKRISKGRMIVIIRPLDINRGTDIKKHL